MKTWRKYCSLFVLIIFSLNCFGQSSDLLSSVPSTKEEFVTSEKNVLATINWLENTRINEEVEKHKTQYALLLAWITNSPTVTLEVNADILTFTKRNSELLIFFMAGWTRYCLENNYSKDKIKGNLAGIEMAIDMYKKNIGFALSHDRAMHKLISLDDKGELESWIEKQLSKK